MNNAKKTAKASGDKKSKDNDSPSNPQSTRETVESVVVAFILAFLFRAFVAEAFVIPTGSMAPTLMGAHKDIFCEFCGEQYQVSASQEFDSETGASTGEKTLASTCAICRGVNAYDFRGNSNHATFSGDRILVSKFDYVLGKPKRWDVFVFKFPRKARMNYIKRLIGLPGESLLITEGDIYTKQEDPQPWTIARKPPHKIQAMKQVVADTNHQAEILNEQGWPSLWQPTDLNQTNWSITRTGSEWSAELSPAPDIQLLRYYHKFIDPEGWLEILDGATLPQMDPQASQLITDYLAYNSRFRLRDASDAFDLKPRAIDQYLPGRFRRSPVWTPKPGIEGDVTAFDYANDIGARIIQGNGYSVGGYHWVGDLSGQFDIEIQSDSGELILDLVEFGIHFRCSIDVATGLARLHGVVDGQPIDLFDGASQVTADTSVKGKGSHVIEFANFDDQLVMWIDKKLIEFSASTAFDSREFRNGSARRPYWTPGDPLDAAPVGIGGTNLDLRVERARVFRDIYYIAIQDDYFSDFDLSRANLSQLATSVPDQTVRASLRTAPEIIESVYSHPEWWSQTDLFQFRGTREFDLDEKQYFPMGDNSAESSDARAWGGHHFVEERFLLGKALLVFWPHTWNSPVPFTPNFARMGLIR